MYITDISQNDSPLILNCIILVGRRQRRAQSSDISNPTKNYQKRRKGILQQNYAVFRSGTFFSRETMKILCVNNEILIALLTYLAPVTVIDFTKHLSKATEPAECCNIESRFWRKLKEKFHPENMKSKSTLKRGMIGNIISEYFLCYSLP